MNWDNLLTIKRVGLEKYHDSKNDARSNFQRDYDRLIFSSPFQIGRASCRERVCHYV